MSDLVRQHVRLREIPRGAEAPLQLVVKAQVDVNLFVARAIERPSSRLRHAARGVYSVAEEDELGVAIRVSLLLEDALPRALRVVEHKGNEAHLGFLAGVIHRTAFGRRGAHRPASEQRQEIAMEYEAEHHQD